MMQITGIDEPGERVILRGRVFEIDGVTPAGGVLLYAYQTDANGVYRKEGGETGNGRRHGVLRGWLRTDESGSYEIRTIRPAPYPSHSEPAHVHVTLEAPGRPEHWVKTLWFAGDDLIPEEEQGLSDAAGAFGRVVTLRDRGDGILVGERDLRLLE
ncbi:MAG: protocatechuate 3,4-dioxygenase beta subunit [Phycisphaerales bacterium]